VGCIYGYICRWLLFYHCIYEYLVAVIWALLSGVYCSVRACFIEVIHDGCLRRFPTHHPHHDIVQLRFILGIIGKTTIQRLPTSSMDMRWSMNQKLKLKIMYLKQKW